MNTDGCEYQKSKSTWTTHLDRGRTKSVGIQTDCCYT